jgi:hypothetical protein
MGKNKKSEAIETLRGMSHIRTLHTGQEIPCKKEDEGLCPVRKCSRGHHSLLHMDKPEEAKERNGSSELDGDVDPEHCCQIPSGLLGQSSRKN